MASGFYDLVMSLSNKSFRQVSIDCDCGNHVTATVFAKPILFDLTCAKCGRHFIEGFVMGLGNDKVWGIKEGVVEEWKITTEEVSCLKT